MKPYTHKELYNIFDSKGVIDSVMSGQIDLERIEDKKLKRVVGRLKPDLKYLYKYFDKLVEELF